MANECSICFELFNKSTRKRTECSKCSGGFCRDCLKGYLLSLNKDPICPGHGCNHSWDWEFLYSQLPKTFVDKAYRKRRGKLLMEREKSLLPATQIIAEQERKKKEELEEIDRQRIHISIQLDELKHQVRTLDVKERGIKTGVVAIEKEDKRMFIMGCPAEDCRGFLSTAYKCGLCDIRVCSLCHEIKDNDHECNKDDVKSVEMKKRDTKPCPKCGARTHKISGCAQIWCVRCHTPWNWNTGRVETGTIHNPHYYQWRAGNAERDEIEIGCDRTISRNALLGYRLRKDIFFVSIIQVCTHILAVEIPILIQDPVTSHQDLRIKYLLGDISDEEWQRQLTLRERIDRKKTELRHILSMFREAALDILSRVRGDTTTNKDRMSRYALRKELYELFVFYNERINIISKTYGNCVVPHICCFNEFITDVAISGDEIGLRTFKPGSTIARRFDVVNVVPSKDLI